MSQLKVDSTFASRITNALRYRIPQRPAKVIRTVGLGMAVALVVGTGCRFLAPEGKVALELWGLFSPRANLMAVSSYDHDNDTFTGEVPVVGLIDAGLWSSKFIAYDADGTRLYQMPISSFPSCVGCGDIVHLSSDTHRTFLVLYESGAVQNVLIDGGITFYAGARPAGDVAGASYAEFQYILHSDSDDFTRVTVLRTPSVACEGEGLPFFVWTQTTFAGGVVAVDHTFPIPPNGIECDGQLQVAWDEITGNAGVMSNGKIELYEWDDVADEPVHTSTLHLPELLTDDSEYVDFDLLNNIALVGYDSGKGVGKLFMYDLETGQLEDDLTGSSVRAVSYSPHTTGALEAWYSSASGDWGLTRVGLSDN